MQTAAAQSLDQPFTQGFDLNPIQPAPAGDRFFLVPGGFSDPDAPEGKAPIRAMLLSHYSLAPSLTRTDNATGDQADIVQNQLYLHADVTAYLASWLMVNADMPFALMQRGEGAAAPKSAVGDLRLGARFGLFGTRNDPFAISPGVDVWLPTGSTANLTGDKTVRAEPYLSIGGKASVFVYAAKIGVRFRGAVDTGSLEVGNSLTYGVAAGLSLFRDVLQIGPELSGTSLMSSDQGDAFSARTSPMTGSIGAKVQLGDFTLGSAFGIGLTEAPGTAPRVFLSFAYNPITQPPKKPKKKKEEAPAEKEAAPRPAAAPPQDVDSDGDDILDSVDACPDQMGEASGSPELHGCPPPIFAEPPPEEIKPAPVPVIVAPPGSDMDGDGIVDTEDSCPQEKGVVQPENDARNGCPLGDAASSSNSSSNAKPGAAPVGAGVTAAASADGPPTATWVGFREKDSKNSLIYVQLNRAVPVETQRQGQTLIFTLRGTRVEMRNNQNPLLTTHFGSAVEKARLVPKGKDLQLIIQLKTKATVSSRLVKVPQGAVLNVELSQE